MFQPQCNVIVIGTSAGGVAALRTLIQLLPASLDAAVFVVMHVPGHTRSHLADVLARHSHLPVSQAVDGETIKVGHVYVAQADRHLMVERDKIRLTYGPKESRVRPSIDVLFRSAALFYGPRATGVVLTGALDDGTAGLWAIKDRGGKALVQDPASAEFDSMPRSAIEYVQVDLVAPLDELAGELMKIPQLPSEAGPLTPNDPLTDLDIEVRIAMEGNGLQSGVMSLGPVSAYTCPDCAGVLVEITDGPIVRYRCHTGHAFSLQTLLVEVNESIHLKLWSTVRAIEERVMLLRQLSEISTEEKERDRFRELADLTERQLAPLHAAALNPDLCSELSP